MKTSERGFSIVEVVIVLVVLGLIGGVGYATFHKKDSNKSGTASTSKAVDANGTTQSTDTILNQEIDDESSVDSSYTSGDVSNAQSANSAASNIGGAYNESNL